MNRTFRRTRRLPVPPGLGPFRTIAKPVPAIGETNVTGIPRVRATFSLTRRGTVTFATPFGLTTRVVAARAAPPRVVVGVKAK